VGNVVNNPKTDCADFIKRLIGAASTKGKASSDDPLTLFDRVNGQAGFKLKNIDPKYGALSSFEGNGRVVYMQPHSSSADPRLLEHSNNAYAVTVLNELMHHARNSGVYTDRTLGLALFKLLTPGQQKEHPVPTSSDVIVNSKYFHSLFNLHCRSELHP